MRRQNCSEGKITFTLRQHEAGKGVKLDFTHPEKPTEKGYVESLNGRLRDEFFKVNQFLPLDHAKEVIEAQARVKGRRLTYIDFWQNITRRLKRDNRSLTIAVLGQSREL